MSDNIQVAIRVRKLIPREENENESIIWDVKDNTVISEINSTSNTFCFDRVFNADADTKQVYDELCFPIVRSVMEGYNGTIFAYGQTSSGKTHTMMGEKNGIIKGIIDYAIQDIFDNIMEMPDREFLVRISFLEIYKEKVYDLLSDTNKVFKLQEDKYGNVVVHELKERIVQTSYHILEFIRIGLRNRRTAETRMNRNSSRSHSIFRMIIESRVKNDENAGVNVSQLNFVDLAGSENMKGLKTNQENKSRQKEGIFINLSLSTLSQVIQQLSKKEREDNYISYRNSKLTRLLQNSLGGNALTAIICTVTPVSAQKSQTVSTLKFASTAKIIKNKPKRNEILTDQALLKQYANQIKELSQELQASKEQGKELEEKTKQNENLKRQIEDLKAKFVSHIAPDKRNKAVRRETWGGHLDAKRLQSVFLAPRTITPSYGDLSTLEEEPEADTDLTEIEADLTFKPRRSSCFSPKRNRNSNFLKNMKNFGMQTDPEYSNDLNVAYDEAMILVSELKRQLTTLQTEYAELTEYTTLEKQSLKAEEELLEEMKVLKTENNFLREQLTLFKPSDNAIKITKKDVAEDNFRSKDSELYNEKIDSSSIQSLNDALCLEKSSFNDTSKQGNERILVNESDSTYLDESSKSQFLALYDDLENEVVSKLKEEIESLKYDNNLKDKQIGLLKDKIEIKEQMLLSLKDEIRLSKSSISNVTSTAEDSAQTFDIHYELDSPESDQTSKASPFSFNSFTNVKYGVTNKSETKVQICQTDIEFKSPNKSKSTKECQTSPTHCCHLVHKNCDTITKIKTCVQICQTDFECGSSKREKLNQEPETISYVNSPKKSHSITELQTSPLCNSHSAALKFDRNFKNETKVQISDADLESSSLKKVKLDKECQTSTYIKCSKCQRLNKAEQSEKDKSSNFDSETESCSRISPIKEYLSSIDTSVKEDKKFLENYRKCLEDGYSQTTPFKSKLLNVRSQDYVFTDEKDIQTSPMKELSLLTEHLKKENMNQHTQAFSKNVGNYNMHKIDQSTVTSPLPKSIKDSINIYQKPNSTLLQNQSDEIKILIEKIGELRAYMFEFMKNNVTTDFMEGIDALIACNEDKLTNVAEQEIATLKALITRLHFYFKDIQEYSELLNNQLELKFEEVISLNLKLSDVQNALDKKEKEVSNLGEKVFKLKDNLSQLTFMSSMINNVESKDELEKLKKLSSTNVDNDSEDSVPTHDIMLMENMVFKLNSYMEENVLQIINLSEKLKSVEDEFATFKKETIKCQTHLETCSGFTKSTQTEFVCDIFHGFGVDKNYKSEKEKTLQFESEIKSFEEKVAKLDEKNKYLEKEIKDMETHQSAQLHELEINHRIAKSEWDLKTRKLINDLETKYEHELSDQENKLSTKLLELKKDHMKREAEFNKELVDVKRTLQREITELCDKHQKEKLVLKSELEEKMQEIFILKKKNDENVASCKRKLQLCRDSYMRSETQNKYYQEAIAKLENENEKMRGRIVPDRKGDESEHLKEKISEVLSDKDKLLKKYNDAKQYILKLKEDMEELKEKLRNQPVLKVSNDSIENDEIKKLLNELDQKKAKIITLESNNASMVTENKKLRELLSSKTGVPCKCKAYSKVSKIDVPSKCENSGKTDYKIPSENRLENLAASTAIGANKKCENDSNEESEQDKILCLGGGSGSANMVKNYWLEGQIHKKDKEIAKLHKEIFELRTQLKAIKSCPVIAPEGKKEDNRKELEVKKTVPFAMETDENITVCNAALHPYQQGAIPKVQPKYILKDKNIRVSGKPYENIPQLKRPNCDFEKQPSTSKPKGNRKEITALEAAKMMSGESECKQQ